MFSYISAVLQLWEIWSRWWWGVLDHLFCQMNTRDPVVFFSCQIRLKNIYCSEWSVNHQTPRGQRAPGFCTNQHNSEHRKPPSELNSDMRFPAWQHRMGEQIWNCYDYWGRAENGLPVTPAVRQKTAVSIGLIFTRNHYDDSAVTHDVYDGVGNDKMMWKTRLWSNYG